MNTTIGIIAVSLIVSGLVGLIIIVGLARARHSSNYRKPLVVWTKLTVDTWPDLPPNGNHMIYFADFSKSAHDDLCPEQKQQHPESAL